MNHRDIGIAFAATLAVAGCGNGTAPEAAQGAAPVRVARVEEAPGHRGAARDRRARAGRRGAPRLQDRRRDPADHRRAGRARASEGQLLATLADDEVAAAVSQARAVAEQAARDLDRGKSLLADEVATREQVEGLATANAVAQAQLRTALFNARHARIEAPADGIVLRKLAEPDEQVAAGQPVLSSATPAAAGSCARRCRTATSCACGRATRRKSRSMRIRGAHSRPRSPRSRRPPIRRPAPSKWRSRWSRAMHASCAGLVAKVVIADPDADTRHGRAGRRPWSKRTAASPPCTCVAGGRRRAQGSVRRAASSASRHRGGRGPRRSANRSSPMAPPGSTRRSRPRVSAATEAERDAHLGIRGQALAVHAAAVRAADRGRPTARCTNIPRSEDPEFHAPVPIVIVAYPGADPVDIERLDRRSDRGRASASSTTSSAWTAGRSTASRVIQIEFHWDQDPDEKYDEVVREVNRIRPDAARRHRELEVRKARLGPRQHRAARAGERRTRRYRELEEARRDARGR